MATRFNTRENLTGYLLIAPFLIFFGVFLFYPIFYSFYLSLHKTTIYSDWYNKIGDMRFVGFGNYSTLLFHEFDFWWSILMTLAYAALTIPAGIVLSLLLALALNKRVRCAPVFRSGFFLPQVLDLLVIGIIWTMIYAKDYGLLDTVFKKLFNSHIFSQGVLATPATILPCIALAMVLKGAGLGMILFLATIQQIPRSLYEAAEVDGASGWRRLTHITLPLVKPIILFMVITGIIGSLNAFTEIFAMTNDTGGPSALVAGHAVKPANIAGYYLYVSFREYFYGKAAAISFLLLIVALIVSGLNYVFLRSEKDLV
ncbi:MAG: sugar ABC transporter permease [bacterium]